MEEKFEDKDPIDKINEDIKEEKENKKRGLHCSFCGKYQTECQKLIAGPNVFICDECIRLCVEIINEECPVQCGPQYKLIPKPGREVFLDGELISGIKNAYYAISSDKLYGSKVRLELVGGKEILGIWVGGGEERIELRSIPKEEVKETEAT